MEFISKCLKELDSQNLSSIAFPGLTTGFHKFPKNVASKNACRAIAQYIDDNPYTNLKEVRFVIHPEDKETFKVKTGIILVIRVHTQVFSLLYLLNNNKQTLNFILHVSRI